MQKRMKRVDWNHLRAFHATADSGSLSAAAVELGLTQPTLSRQVQALERELDVVLFERSGRRLVLTQMGHELLEHIGSMKNLAESVALTASGQTQEVRGRVRISASDSMATYVLPDIVGRLRTEAPQLTIELLVTNTNSNLHQMEADLAIRHAAPDHLSLAGWHLYDSEAYFYASKDWVQKNGYPASMADLGKVDLIGFDDIVRLSGHFRSMGIPVDAADFKLISSSAVAGWEMVKRGLGVAAMLNEVAHKTPDIVKLLPDLAPVRVPLWLVTHKELQASTKVKLVQKVLTEELAQRA